MADASGEIQSSPNIMPAHDTIKREQLLGPYVHTKKKPAQQSQLDVDQVNLQNQPNMNYTEAGVKFLEDTMQKGFW